MPVSSHIILETGTSTTRAGFAGDKQPTINQPTVLGRGTAERSSEVYVGSAVADESKNLVVSEPVSGGSITNWTDIELLWRKVIAEQLQVKPGDHAVVLLDSPVQDVSAREKMAKIMFESLNVQKLFLGNPAVFTSYAAGRLNSVVLEMGDGVIHAVPVIDGFAVREATRTWSFGGNGQTKYLGKLLKERGVSLEPATVKQVKESLCYVAENFKAEMNKSTTDGFEKSMKLADGTTVTLGSEMFKTYEILFQPDLAGVSAPGVAAMIHDAVSHCPPEKQTTLYDNVILGGGPALAPGFAKRLQRELRTLSGKSVDVVAPPTAGISAWLGASILAVLPDFQSMWVTREEYKQQGSAIIHTKCK